MPNDYESFESREIVTTRVFQAPQGAQAVYERAKIFAVPANEENFDRLEAVLAEMTA